jgi:hypothetical protein
MEYLEEKILGPMMASMARVCLDLGSSCQAHGQNTHLEIGRDGHPTGRMVHADLEAFWPHPEIAKLNGHEDFFARHGLMHVQLAESNIFGTFQTYFINENLEPLLSCLAQHDPELGEAARTRANELIKREVHKRKDLVTALKDGPLKGFYDTYIKGS